MNRLLKSASVILFATLTSVLGAGCANDEEGAVGATTEAARLVIAPSDEPSDIPTALLDSEMRSASEFQRALLADGRVSIAEYERAKLAEIQCLTEAGLAVEGATSIDGLYRIRFAVRATAEQASRAPEMIQSCYREFASSIDRVWIDASAPLVQTVISASREIMADCYRAAALKPEDRPHQSLDPADVEAHRRCIEEMESKLNIEGIWYGVDGDGRR